MIDVKKRKGRAYFQIPSNKEIGFVKYNKIFEFNLEGTNDQDKNNRIKIYQLLCATWQCMHHSSTHVHFLTHNP